MGDRGRLEKFFGNTYAPLLTRKPVKALVIAVFGIIFVSGLDPKLCLFAYLLAGYGGTQRCTVPLLPEAFRRV